MATYLTLSDDQAERFLNADRDEATGFLDDYVTTAGAGEPLALECVFSLKQKLGMIKQTFPSVIKKGTSDGGRYEQLGSEYVHRELSVIPHDVLANPGFWTWIAVTQFPEVIEWRFGATQGQVALANYGIHNPKENMIYRMWLRGEIGFDADSTDPYELARAGDQDLWRSHIIRQGYGNVREVAKALLRLQAGKLDHAKLSVDQIRALAKSIKRLRANTYLEVLTADQANALVLELCEGV